MADKRPFVDRRLGIVVTFDGRHGGIAESEEETHKKGLNDMLDDMGLEVYVTQVENKPKPPQQKIILSDSMLKADTIQRIKSKIKSDYTEVGGRVKDVHVVALALSPGDKVRNAMGV